VLAVALGGAVGTGLRFALDWLLPHHLNEFPTSTLVANVIGALVLGFIVARMWSTSPHWLRAGLGTGLLGSFTTFSAVMVSLVALGNNSEWLLALAYLASTLTLGLLAAFAGLRAGALRQGPRDTLAAQQSATWDIDRGTE
jgi:CrcB protein